MIVCPATPKSKAKKWLLVSINNKISARKQADRPLVANKGDNQYRLRLMRATWTTGNGIRAIRRAT
jgi:hypothetical protein